ncbi:MAG TPA: 2'-5' RNA ligase family protein [Acidimicrobiales bacterium]|nr:2'-5' RNA ligase family protein [Acidimicrobiales bacterium]
MRLFVAVEVPDEVADVLAALDRPAFEGLRWTTRDQWHVTLRFLGEVPDPEPVVAALRTVPALFDASGAESSPSAASPAASASTGSVEATIGPVTAWFPGRHVLHVAVRGLEVLARVTAQALADAVGADEGDQAGVGDLEAHPFVGHVTLARAKGRRPGPARLAGVPVHVSWSVHTVALMGSTLGPGGSKYETRATVALNT